MGPAKSMRNLQKADILVSRAPLAQLDRASASGAEGCQFDPGGAYHSSLTFAWEIKAGKFSEVFTGCLVVRTRGFLGSVKHAKMPLLTTQLYS